jgi:hypothetical protein
MRSRTSLRICLEPADDDDETGFSVRSLLAFTLHTSLSHLLFPPPRGGWEEFYAPSPTCGLRCTYTSFAIPHKSICKFRQYVPCTYQAAAPRGSTRREPTRMLNVSTRETSSINLRPTNHHARKQGKWFYQQLPGETAFAGPLFLSLPHTHTPSTHTLARSYDRVALVAH